jgi:hypothetical protein
MTPLPPEEIGIARVTLFRIPIAGGKDLLLMLPKNYADLLNARAQAAHISTGQYLADLIRRALGT